MPTYRSVEIAVQLGGNPTFSIRFWSNPDFSGDDRTITGAGQLNIEELQRTLEAIRRSYPNETKLSGS